MFSVSVTLIHLQGKLFHDKFYFSESIVFSSESYPFSGLNMYFCLS